MVRGMRRQHKKRIREVKRRSTMASALESKLFQHQIVTSKLTYNRGDKHGIGRTRGDRYGHDDV